MSVQDYLVMLDKRMTLMQELSQCSVLQDQNELVELPNSANMRFQSICLLWLAEVKRYRELLIKLHNLDAN